MSEIDGYFHGYAGSIAGLPIYVLEEDAPSFNAKDGDILIGGGSGEHPHCRIVDKGQAAMFWYESFSDWRKESFEKHNLEIDLKHAAAFDYIDKNISALIDPMSFIEMLDYRWSMKDVSNFYEGLKKLHNPFNHRSMESVLYESIAEVLIFCMPALLPDDVRRVAHNKIIKDFIFPVYRNVQCDPPGMPNNSGKRIDDGGIRNIRWGHSAYKGKWSNV